MKMKREREAEDFSTKRQKFDDENDSESDIYCSGYLFSEDEMDSMNDMDGIGGIEGMNGIDGCINAVDTDSTDNGKKPYWQLRSELASWACTSGSGNTESSLSDLLKILQPYGFKNLPSDARTLMDTPRDTSSLIRNVDPGKYIHIGIRRGIEFELKINSVDVSQITEIVIDYDMDGVKICKSTSQTFWPIWCRIRCPFIGKPFLVGNYLGKGEPADANLYVLDFVNEFKSLVKNGLKVANNKIISIRFGRFIGDSPGRCCIFGLKGATGYYGCPRCTVKGTRHHNRTCFTELDAPLRTDQNFRSREQPEHHNFTSTFEDALGIDCITQIPLDGMHLIYAGVTNRLLFWYVTDVINFKFKLSSSQINIVNDKLETAALSQPKEFSRPVKDIRQHKQFKCTQHRVFLLYLSIVVFKDILTKFQYEHFLLLCIGIRILSDEKQFKRNNSVAKNMLNEYVKILGAYFGRFRLIFSFHLLIHLADETLIQNEPLDKFSMWEFESANASLKKFTLRQGAYLEQCYNRTIERYANSTEIVSQSPSYPTLKLETGRQFDKTNHQMKTFFDLIEFEKFILTTSYADRWMLTKSRDIVKFEQAIQVKDTNNTQIKIIGRAVKNKNDFFEKPLRSSFLNIYECSDRKLSAPIEFDVGEICSKVFMIRNGEKMVFIPLL